MRDVKATTFAALLAVLAIAGGCASNKKEVAAAKHSLYDADFAVIYSAALESVRKLYPNIDDTPGNGAIKTAWHQVQYASDPTVGADTGRSVSTGNGYSTGTQGGQNVQGGSPAGNAAGMPTRLAYKRFYVRFDVSVIGGRPWRVKVVGHASEWEPGAAMPSELKGAAKPSWLDPRVDSLRVAIYEKIKAYAVPMKDDDKKEEKEVTTDPAVFAGVPPGAAKLLARTKDTLAKRDYQALRPDLADDVTWNPGQEPGADTAMAMWQADPDTFDTLGRLINGGCAADGDKRVTCPATAPAIGQWQLVLEPRGGDWRIASFMRVE